MRLAEAGIDLVSMSAGSESRCSTTEKLDRRFTEEELTLVYQQVLIALPPSTSHVTKSRLVVITVGFWHNKAWWSTIGISQVALACPAHLKINPSHQPNHK